MKCIFLPVLLMGLSMAGFSQSFRLHVGGGFANYIGDIQDKRLAFNQIKGMYIFGVGFDINERVSIRVDFAKGQLGADDKNSNVARTLKRNLNFKTDLQEVAVLAEYYWPNTYTGSFVPYVVAGIGIFKFSPYTYDSVGRQVFLHDLSTEGQGLSKYPDRKPYKLQQFCIPLGAGFKYKMTESVFLTAEGGLRKLFTDYLDDVSLTYADEATLRNERGQLAVDLAFRGDELAPYNKTYPKAGSQRGNKDKDWYYFVNLKMNFIIKWSGRNSFSSGKSALRRLGCPVRF